MKPSTVRVCVLVMPTPPLWNSVKYARPSSRTAMPKAGGVITLSTSSPLGCVFGSQLGAAVAIRTPGVAGGNGACAVGGDLSVHAQNEAAPQLRSRPAMVVRCMRASRDVRKRRVVRTPSDRRVGGWAATLIPECVVRLTRFVVLGYRQVGGHRARSFSASRVARERQTFQNDRGVAALPATIAAICGRCHIRPAPADADS